MLLSELLAEAGMKLWRDREGCETFFSQARRCIAMLSDPDIKDIDTNMVDAFIAKLEKLKSHRGRPLASQTINHNVSVLSTLLKYAKQRDYITKLPHFSRKRPAPHRVRWLSPDEEVKVFAAIDNAEYLIARKHREEMKALTKILIDTGMRRGEVLGLTKDNMDGQWARLWKTKTGKARSVPLTPEAKELLEKHVPFQIKEHQVHRFWAKVREDIGLEKDEQFVLHTLRHTTATRMLKKTKNIAMVQKMLGHTNISTTLRYAHIDDQDLLEAVNSQ